MIHDANAEQSVLGALMLDNSALYRVMDKVRSDDFWDYRHRTIYEAIHALTESDRPADAVTVSDYIEEHRGKEALENVGGLGYLGTLAKDTPSAANVAAYAEIVADHAYRRNAVKILSEAADKVSEGESEAVSEAQAKLEGLGRGGAGLSFSEVLGRTLTMIDKRMQRGDQIARVRTGLPTIDRATGGFEEPRLHIIAARPSLGKTAFSWQICADAARRGVPIGRVDLEMSAEEMGIRAMANAYKVSNTWLARGRPEEMEKVQERVLDYNIRDWPIWINDDLRELDEVCGQITEWRRKHNIEACVVDHIGKLYGPPSMARHEFLGLVTNRLDSLAKRLKMPILGLCQLSRGKGEEGRPTIDKLRESGRIEEDAHMILMVHGEREADAHGYAPREIGVLKNRAGVVGWFSNFRLNGTIQRFEEVEDG